MTKFLSPRNGPIRFQRTVMSCNLKAITINFLSGQSSDNNLAINRSSSHTMAVTPCPVDMTKYDLTGSKTNPILVLKRSIWN